MTTPEQKYPATPPIPAQTAMEFLQDIRHLVAFQQAIGIEGYPRTPGITRLVAGQQQTGPPGQPKTLAKTPAARPRPAPAVMPNANLTELYTEMQACQRCPRQQSRNRVISGEAATGVKLLIITDAPSAEDDLSGLPISGEPGLLLDKMLAAIALSRADVHLSLLTRCHAPEPADKEAVEACLPFLLKEILLVAPRIICAMGVLTAQKLLHTSKPLSQLRGRFHDFQGIPLMPTFSPEFLLKNQELKKATWLDLQLIQKKIQAV
ncbi:MAG: uracil-DNA glycosylase [Desulfurivibrionaceae bacterium]